MLGSIVLLFAAPPLFAQSGWFKDGAKQILASPLIVDLNADGKSEIVTVSFDDKLYIYNHNGTVFNPGTAPWPKTLGFGDGSIGSAAVGNIDGGTDLEIVIVGDSATSNNAAVKVLKTNGNVLASYTLGANASGKATPCLINCYRYNGTTAHPSDEILIRDGDGRMHILYWNGSNGLLACDTTSTFDTLTTDTYKDRLGSQPITSSAAAVDLGNGTTYVVVGSTDNKVYRWQISSTSGNSANNFSVTPLSSLTASTAGGRFLSSPAIADLDNDGTYEVIAGYSKGGVYVWNSNGSLRDGWPQPTIQAVVSSPAVADIDGNGTEEIIVGSDDGAIYAWDHQGNLVAGTPLLTGGDVFASPLAVEIDGQPGLEIVAASLDGHLYLWDYFGQFLPLWPKRLNTPIYSSPAVGAIHGGDRMSIVVSGYDGRIFVFDLATKSLDPDSGWRQFRGGPARTGSQ